MRVPPRKAWEGWEVMRGMKGGWEGDKAGMIVGWEGDERDESDDILDKGSYL